MFVRVTRFDNGRPQYLDVKSVVGITARKIGSEVWAPQSLDVSEEPHEIQSALAKARRLKVTVITKDGVEEVMYLRPEIVQSVASRDGGAAGAELCTPMGIIITTETVREILALLGWAE